jgi:hypothetical protein
VVHGGSPPPEPLWHWDEVAAWFQATGGVHPSESRTAALAAINGILANRQLAREHPDYLKRIQRLAG